MTDIFIIKWEPQRWCIDLLILLILWIRVPLALLVVDNYLKETPKFGIKTQWGEEDWVVNGEISIDKTKSLLTGTESKAEERQRAAREKIKRDIGQNSEKDDRTKRERNERKKEHTFTTRWVGRDACVRSHTDGIPCFHAYTAIFSYSLPSCSSSSPRSLLFSLLLSKFRFHSFFHTFLFFFFLSFSKSQYIFCAHFF